MKSLKFNNTDVKLKFTSYRNNDTLAVVITSPSDDEFYEVITVNLNSPLQTDRIAFVDENNLPGIGAWLKDNGVASPLGFKQRSGFCLYELYAFHRARK